MLICISWDIEVHCVGIGIKTIRRTISYNRHQASVDLESVAADFEKLQEVIKDIQDSQNHALIALAIERCRQMFTEVEADLRRLSQIFGHSKSPKSRLKSLKTQLMSKAEDNVKNVRSKVQQIMETLLFTGCQWGAKLRLALTWINIPYAVTASFAFACESGQYALRPALAIQHVVKNTSPGFEALFLCETFNIRVEECKDRLRHMYQSDVYFKHHVNPAGKGYLRFAGVTDIQALILAGITLPCLDPELAHQRERLLLVNFLGQSSLHLAVGNIQIVTMLINLGHDLDMTDNWVITPLMYAAAMGFEEVAVHLLLRGANPWLQDARFNRTFLDYAIIRGHWNLIHKTLSALQDMYQQE
ncbi:ankyrin repeat-containing protein [Diaporthe eres]|nr:ankyrin repeat-containing protein [Diaporthe eres]